MSSLIGAIRVTLSMNSAAFEKGADIAQKRAAALGKNLQAMGSKLTSLGTKLSVGLTLPFVALVSKAIPAALEAREAIGQVNAALASMGPVADRTSAQLQKFAGDLQHISTFDDDEILKKVTANMLTFGNISGESFDRAQLAAVNLSARLGQDLQSSAIQVGKALNDPIKGVTALRRVGVQLTQQQQEQVKAMVAVGDTAGAQKIILGELEREFGGAAKAMRDASPGSDLQEKWRTFQEVVGEVALKVLPPLTTFLTKLLALFNSMSPTTQTVVVAVVALSAALGPVLVAAGSLITIIGTLTPALVALGVGLTGVAAAEGTAATASYALGAAIRTCLPILGAVALAVTGVYLAWKNWDKIKPIVQNMVEGVAQHLRGRLRQVLEDTKSDIHTVGDKFRELYDRVVGHSYVPDMVDEIGQHMARLSGLMVDPAQNATKAAGDAFEALKARVSGVFDRLYPDRARFNQFEQDLADLEAYAKKSGLGIDALSDAMERLNEEQFALPKVNLETQSLVPAPNTQDWSEGVGETFDRTRSLTSQIAGGLTDALLSATEGWKAMRDTAINAIRQIVQEMLRAQITKAIMSIVSTVAGGGGFSSSSFAATESSNAIGLGLPADFFRASGGPVMSGRPYIVGERGPEMFVPRGSGEIVPNHMMGGGAPFVFNNYADMTPAQARKTGNAGGGWLQR
jgi:hypothetical protein